MQQCSLCRLHLVREGLQPRPNLAVYFLDVFAAAVSSFANPVGTVFFTAVFLGFFPPRVYSLVVASISAAIKRLRVHDSASLLELCFASCERHQHFLLLIIYLSVFYAFRRDSFTISSFPRPCLMAGKAFRPRPQQT